MLFFVYLHSVKAICKLAVKNKVMLVLAHILVKKKYTDIDLAMVSTMERTNAQYKPNYIDPPALLALCKKGYQHLQEQGLQGGKRLIGTTRAMNTPSLGGF
jgi:hypothetical protein